MGNRKTFNDFNTKSLVHDNDYLIGFDVPDVGGEKKFKLSSLKDFIHSVDVVVMKYDGTLPIVDPNSTQLTPEGFDEVPFLSGKLFHVESDDHVLVELPDLKNFEGPRVSCAIVNMTDNKRVEIKTINGTPTLNARGVVSYETGLSDSTTVTFLKKKYDTGLFYYDGNAWFGYGDLDGPTSLNIKDIDADYTFTLEDEDKILHFKHSTPSGGAKFTLPEPSKMKSGTQFFVHNISNGWIEFEVPDGVNFHARAKFLRRKYDDAAVYTDGADWFATGDLS